jgi:hypothetical protein
MDKEPESVFVLHNMVYESQCPLADILSVFLTIEEARAKLEDMADSYRHLKSFEMLEDDFTASRGDRFHHVWIETVLVSHYVKGGN